LQGSVCLSSQVAEKVPVAHYPWRVSVCSKTCPFHDMPHSRHVPWRRRFFFMLSHQPTFVPFLSFGRALPHLFFFACESAVLPLHATSRALMEREAMDRQRSNDLIKRHPIDKSTAGPLALLATLF